MLEQVEKKIEEFKITQAKEYYKKKDADLEAWGLSSKKEGKKRVPIIITNSEYEELVKASNGVGDTGRNKVAKFLNTMAIVVLILGVIAGIGGFSLAESMGFVYFSLAVVLAVIFAAVLKGVAEAVRLLQQILDARFVEAPEISEEELKKADAKAPKAAEAPVYAVPEQQYNPYPPQHAEPVAPVAPPMAPVAQPPIYQAQYHQPPMAQPYPAQPYVYPAQPAAVEPLNAEEMGAAYEMFSERSTEPQQFD